MWCIIGISEIPIKLLKVAEVEDMLEEMVKRTFDKVRRVLCAYRGTGQETNDWGQVNQCRDRDDKQLLREDLNACPSAEDTSHTENWWVKELHELALEGEAEQLSMSWKELDCRIQGAQSISTFRNLCMFRNVYNNYFCHYSSFICFAYTV